MRDDIYWRMWGLEWLLEASRWLRYGPVRLLVLLNHMRSHPWTNGRLLDDLDARQPAAWLTMVEGRDRDGARAYLRLAAVLHGEISLHGLVIIVG